MPGEPHLLHDFFHAAAARHPDRIAIEVPPGVERPERRSITYADLRARSARLASALAPHARPDARVAVFLPRHAVDLYTAQLAILGAGAAFLCLDPRFPDDFLRAALEDARPAALVTDAAGRARLGALGPPFPPTFDAADIGSDLRRPRGARPGRRRARGLGAPTVADPAHLAYVIFTSGTTGRPKGVMVEHRGIVNLVASDLATFGLTADDRVAQCSSPAYDSSIEETWLALAVGAALVVLDDDTVRSGPDLVPWLRRERITVFCPPPTLLRSMGCADPRAQLPGIRLLYVGGEALPADLADLWSAGRWMENGYGPTECAVTATRGRVRPDAPVTIGRPVPGNTARVLDGDLEPVPDGEAGELCLGGAGLARGYLGADDLTAAKFPVHPRFGRIYRTGDLGRWNAAGELEYLGRLDGQVKLRGYRVELGAVEAHLAAQPGIRAAACRVQGEGAAAVLTAHVVPDPPDAAVDPAALKSALRRALPEYMVPARFATLAALPTTVGGKLDRRALAEIDGAASDIGAPRSSHQAPAPSDRPPGGAPFPGPPPAALEAEIAAAFARALDLPGTVPPDADFFVDLGGSSLGAVAVVTALRCGSLARHATVRDVYEARTVARLAARLRERGMGDAPGSAPSPRAIVDEGGGDAANGSSSALVAAPGADADDPWVGSSSQAARHPILVTAAQAAWLAGELWVGAIAGYFGVFELAPRVLLALGLVPSLLLLPWLLVAVRLAYAPLAVAWAVGVKRVLIGRYTPRREPVWGGFYLRHWIVAHSARHIPWGWLAGTAACGAVLRLLGARVGRRVHVHRGVDLSGGGWDLLTTGDDVTLAQDAAVRLTELDHGDLVIGPISLGDGATLDVRAGVSPDSAVGPGGYLTALSWLPPGATIPAGQRWDGVPAVPAGDAPDPPATGSDRSIDPSVPPGKAPAGSIPLHPALFDTIVILTAAARGLPSTLALGIVLALAAHAGGLGAAAVAAWLEAPSLDARAVAGLLGLSALAVPVALFVQALGLRALGRVPEGAHAASSRAALAVWLKTGAVAGAGRWLSGSLYWMPWLRLAGMRIGRGAEISTVIDVVPETVAVGAESFFADGIYFCGPRRQHGTVAVAATALGAGTFLGNHAVVPAGRTYPDGLFVGVATVADADLARPGTAWFGHPPLELPRREVAAADRRLTHDPDTVRYLTRLFWETLRFALPAVPGAAGLAWVAACAYLAPRMSSAAFLGLVLPAVTAAALALPAVAALGLKWLLLGRVKPGRHPFWSCWCGRWDFVYVAWQHWALGPLSALDGTLLLNAWLRLTGVRIGRGVVLGRGFAQVVDPDMLRFDDGATVACQLQAHTFEDRVLKIDRLRIRSGASVGPNAVVFYGAEVGPGAHVAPHSVVMKGEVLPGGGRYAGCPTREAEPGRGGPPRDVPQAARSTE